MELLVILERLDTLGLELLGILAHKEIKVQQVILVILEQEKQVILVTPVILVRKE
jgi:hypothetical protein